MKYICLGYIEPGKFEGMTEDERNAVFDECFEHNDHLRANGHLVAEMALQDISRLAIATAAPLSPLLLTIFSFEELIMRLVKVVF